MYIDVDTAVTVPVNVAALVDDTDFKTRETSVAYNATGMDLVWNFITTAGVITQTAVTPTTGGDYDWSEIGDAMYKIEIPASGGASINNNAEGAGWFSGIITGILSFRGPTMIFRAAGLNSLLINNAFSTTRGLTGTAVPAVAADAAGGLPISDAGGLNLDTLLGTLTSLAAETRDANILDQFKRTIAIVETQRGSHSHQPIGNIYFVDPTNGDTHANGNRGGITDPYKGIQDCHDNAVTDSNHDTIILLSGAAAGATTLTETVSITKRYLFIRGPGRDFIVIRTGDGDTVTITADGVELSGMQIKNASGAASGNAVAVSGADFAKVQHCWLPDSADDAIDIDVGSNYVITNNVITGCARGIHVNSGAGSAAHGQIADNTIYTTTSHGIHLAGVDASFAEVHHNRIWDIGNDGVFINSACTDCMVVHNEIGNCTNEDIDDDGTDTVVSNNDEWAKHSIATESRLAELDAANIPADVDTIDGIVDSILLDTAEIGTAGAGLTDVTVTTVANGAIGADAVTDIFETQTLTEAYAADGAAATPAQLMYMLWSVFSQFSISSTTVTGKKLDGTTTSMTFTLDDDTTPTSRVRAS